MLTAIITFAALAASPGQSADAPAAPEKKICKKTVDTGSLVRGRKICRTRAEWAKSARTAREEAEKMQDRGLIQPTNGVPGGG